jgi:uncharacterized protein YndB with AHSA1/START domain
MVFDLQPDFPVTDAACKEATGKTLTEWYAYLDKEMPGKNRRDIVSVRLWKELSLDIWWATTIGVEYERHLDKKKKDGLYEGYSICSTKTFKAPISAVYAEWVNLAQMAKWMEGSVEGKMEVGSVITSADGESYEVLRVREDKDLRFDFNLEGMEGVTRIDVAFEDKGNGKSGINVHHKRLQNRGEADSVRRTWADAMDRLKAQVE